MAITGGNSTVTEAAASSTSIAATKPALTAATDVILIAHFAATAAPTAIPTGWKVIPATNLANGGNYTAGYYKSILAASVASEPSTYTFTFASSTCTVIIKAYYGVVSLRFPFDPSFGLATATATTSLGFGALMVSSQNSMLISGFGEVGTTANPATLPASMTSVGASTGTGRAAKFAEQAFAAGGQVTKTWTSTAVQHGAWIIALNATLAPNLMLYTTGLVNSLTNVTVAFPASTTREIHDVMLLFVETAGGEAVPVTVAGMQEMTSSPVFTGATTAGTRLTVFWQRVFSSQSTNLQILLGDPGDHIGYIAWLIRGCYEFGNPVDVIATGVKATTSTALTMPAITTTVANTFVMQVITNDLDSATPPVASMTNASLTPFVNVVNTGHTTGNGGGIAVYVSTKEVAGAVSAASGTASASQINAMMSLALKPTPYPQLPLPTFRLRDGAHTQNSGFVNTQALTMPANITAGDLLIAYLSASTGGGVTMDISGWTALFTARSDSPTCTQGIFWKVATGSDTATATSNGFINWTAVIHSYAGANTTSAPPYVLGGPQTGTNPVAPDLTSTVDGSHIFRIVSANGAGMMVPPSGLTDRGNVVTDSASGSQTAVYVEDTAKSPVGAVGTKTVTTTAFTEWYSVTLEIRPAPTNNSYTDSLTTTVVGVSTETDLGTLVDSPVTTAVSVTSDVDKLTAAETLTTTVVGVTSETEVRALTESVTDLIVSVTTETDTWAIVEVPQTVINGVSTITDTLTSSGIAYTDSIADTIVSTSSIADSVVNSVAAQTDITLLQSLTDTMGAVEAPSTVIVGQTSSSEAVTRADSIQTVVIASTGVAESQGYAEPVVTTAVAQTSSTDLLAYLETTNTVIVADTTMTDNQGGSLAEYPLTNVAALTSITEVVSYSDSVATTITSLTGETDQLGLYFDAQTTGLTITSVVDMLSYLESVITNIVATTTPTTTDSANFVSVVLSIINAVADSTDILNGQPPPVTGYLLYQAGPFKVMGKI